MWHTTPDPEVINTFSCSSQWSMKFSLLINVKMPTIFNIYERENSILGFPDPKKSQISWHFYTYEHLKFNAQMSWAWKKFYNLGARFKKTLRFTYRSRYCLIGVKVTVSYSKLSRAQHLPHMHWLFSETFLKLPPCFSEKYNVNHEFFRMKF